MAKRLADTRTMTMADAEQAFAELAQATLRMERRNAMAEVKIASIKAALAESNAADAAEVAAAEGIVQQYVLTHPDEFKRPRQRQTEFGKFGLRTATKVAVLDEDETIMALMDLGYDDCMQVQRKLDKAEIAKRIQGGEHIPGCSVESGDLLTYTIDKALRDAAREAA